MKKSTTLFVLFFVFQVQAQSLIIALQDKASNKCLQLKNGEAVRGNTFELADCDEADSTPTVSSHGKTR